MMRTNRYKEVYPTPDIGGWLELYPGILWLRMPLPYALDHVNLYLLEDSNGWYLVDTGLNYPGTHEVWKRVVAQALGDKPLKGILATHYHPDHVGCAGWLAKQWQLPIWMSAQEYDDAQALQRSHGQAVSDELLHYYRMAGHDSETVSVLADSWQMLAQFYAPLPDQYIELKEGERLSIGGDDWRIIVTKGHSPAHVCFYNEQRQLLISGDQVLPFISSNVSAIAHRPEENPLKDWLEGLTRLSDLPANTLVLPAHNHPFHGLQRRVQQLVDEHQALLDQILSLLQQPMTVRQLSLLLYPRAIQGLDLSLATGETLAHLRYLVEQQRLNQALNDKDQWLFARA